MSAIFEEMDRLAAEKCAATQEATFDMPRCDQRTEEVSHQSVKESPDAVDSQHLETSDTGAIRHEANYRYDLIPVPIVIGMLSQHPKALDFAIGLFRYVEGKEEHCWSDLADLLGVRFIDLIHLYAQALHDEATKHGERNWELGLPESIFLNQALYHLFKLVGGNSTENHQAHIAWNVMSLVYQRGAEACRASQEITGQHKGDQ